MAEFGPENFTFEMIEECPGSQLNEREDFWQDYLASKNIDVNSVGACIEIYKFYKEENRGSKEKAIKEYKGIENNIYLIERTLMIRDKILKILKESK